MSTFNCSNFRTKEIKQHKITVSVTTVSVCNVNPPLMISSLNRKATPHEMAFN